MSFFNNLLFSHSFLAQFLNQNDVSLAVDFIRQGALDYYKNIRPESNNSLVRSWIRPLLLMQGVNLIPAGDDDEHVYFLTNPEADPNLPISCCVVAPYGEPLDGWDETKWLSKGRHWMARTVRASKRLARRMGPEQSVSSWAILTNGQQWRILKTDHLRKYEAYLEVDLHAMLAGQADPLAAVIFRHCFSREAFVPGEHGVCQLDQWLSHSEKTTSEVERHLRTSVSDNLDSPGDSDGIMAQICMGLVASMEQQTFTDQERGAIYRDATYLLYRLLFIFYAESRDLLPTQLPAYQAISLEKIVAMAMRKLQAPDGELLKTDDIWQSLLTLFEAIRESSTALGVPKYNGGLFENDDKPYLRQYQIADAFLAPALFDLAYLKTGEDQFSPIDYRDLSVRHLGSLYEGMIEYKLFVAEEDLLARRDKKDKVVYLPAAKTKKEARDELIQAGHVYFAQSPTERKATGTHYTPEVLVARLIEQTVLRLLDERWQLFQSELGPWLEEAEQAAGAAREKLQARIDRMIQDFIQTQVLSLRVCDPAMGSGHFLVHAAHRITDFILEKLSEIARADDNINLQPDFWRRQVVENCLYGVDINEMAVELSKLSLWLATMDLGKPLSFLDHHLVCGNSLVSTTIREISDALSMDVLSTFVKTRRTDGVRQMALTEGIESEDPFRRANDLLRDIREKIVQTAGDVKLQEMEYRLFQVTMQPYWLIGNLLAARKFGWRVDDATLYELVSRISHGVSLTITLQKSMDEGLAKLQEIHPIHWELTFLDVFLEDQNGRKTGFDIVVGNPPYLGGRKISGNISDEFLKYLKNVYQPSFGLADLCAYVLRQGYELLLQADGTRYLGFVVTNTISQGDTRRTGLLHLQNFGGNIIYADRYVPWEGDATVEVNVVVLSKQSTEKRNVRNKTLDGYEVPYISSYLDDLPDGDPFELAQNLNRCFMGDAPMGDGFFIENDEAKILLSEDHQNQFCLLPFITGSDLNKTVNQTPTRYVICFRDMVLGEAEKYPLLLEIVRNRVKPYRDTNKEKRSRKNWWLFARYRKALRKAITSRDKVLVRSEVSEQHMLAFVSKDYILDHKLVVFAYDDFYHFAILQSRVHEVWLRRNASTMRTDISYGPSDCFRTFAFPQNPSDNVKKLLSEFAEFFYFMRRKVMDDRQIGLTNLYNLIHNPDVADTDITDLRHASAKMDLAVLACYGWEDVDPLFGFYPNQRKKIRFGMDPDSQREIFIRLLNLNHEIAAAEAAQGLDGSAGEDEEVAEDEE